MSLYTNFQIVDSPLSDELQPLLRISKRDLRREYDPTHQRMLTILMFVLLLVTTFSVAFSRTFLVNGSRETTGLAVDSRPASQLIMPAVAPLSPVFSAEVQHWSNEIEIWAKRHQLDPDIVATIMQIESCGDPLAVSSAGALGLFQVMPFHFQEGENGLDPDTNALRGLSYYQQQLQETRHNVFLSFAGYNGGSGASSSGWDNWPHETQRYYVWSKGIYEDAKAGLTESPTLARWMAAGGASLCRQAAERLGLDVPVSGD